MIILPTGMQPKKLFYNIFTSVLLPASIVFGFACTAQGSDSHNATSLILDFLKANSVTTGSIDLDEDFRPRFTPATNETAKSNLWIQMEQLFRQLFIQGFFDSRDLNEVWPYNISGFTPKILNIGVGGYPQSIYLTVQMADDFLIRARIAKISGYIAWEQTEIRIPERLQNRGLGKLLKMRRTTILRKYGNGPAAYFVTAQNDGRWAWASDPSIQLIDNPYNTLSKGQSTLKALRNGLKKWLMHNKVTAFISDQQIESLSKISDFALLNDGKLYGPRQLNLGRAFLDSSFAPMQWHGYIQLNEQTSGTCQNVLDSTEAKKYTDK